MNEPILVYHIGGAGLGNILLDLENALATSFITNRKVLIPEDIHHSCGQTTKNSPGEDRIWQILDKQAIHDNFNVEFVENYDFYNRYFKIKESNASVRIIDKLGNGECVYNSNDITDMDDFTFFLDRRIYTTDLANIKEPVLVINGSLLHFYYNIYPGGKHRRNLLKQKINNAIKFKAQYYDIADKSIKKITNKYNAIHVRYPWFFPNPGTPTSLHNAVNIRNHPERLAAQIKLLYEPSVPLYISTDIHKAGLRGDPVHYVDLNEYLDPIKKDYDIILLEDLNLNLTPTEELAIEQIICTNAEKFYGTYYSTFSKRINIFRGIQGGKQVADYMGYDLIQDSYEVDSHCPWAILHDHWEWFRSSYVQYTYEN